MVSKSRNTSFSPLFPDSFLSIIPCQISLHVYQHLVHHCHGKYVLLTSPDSLLISWLVFLHPISPALIVTRYTLVNLILSLCLKTSLGSLNHCCLLISIAFIKGIHNWHHLYFLFILPHRCMNDYFFQCI